MDYDDTNLISFKSQYFFLLISNKLKKKKKKVGVYIL